ncbi:hypothetical protein F5887DRAFT_1259533 [Amanita rubescens]|nr:hypothetical protein F5887DRAFT_1259533 [Amanita rubescens]
MANELRFGALETGNRLVLTSSGAFHAVHDFTINNSTFNDVHGDFIYAQNYYEAPTTANRTPSPPLALPKHSSTLFTGRDTYLGKLREHFGLRASPNDLARRSFLLYGMGGIGKTQICLKFMEDSEDQFSHLFWIDASSEATMTSAIRQIAKEHGLQASNNAKPSVVTVMKWISSLKNDWLMVFDNANHDPDVVEKFIPPGNKGNILITSRNMSMGRVTSNKSMEVEEMNKGEAVSLLLKAGNVDVMDKESEEMAMQIVSALFYLPLAIDQAGSYILSCQCSLNDYWQLYKRNYQLLRDDTTFKGASDYGKSVYGTWEISIQEIESRAKNQSKAAQSAISLLKFIPFLHHVNIPENIFKYAAMGFRDRDTEEAYELPMLLSLLDSDDLQLNESGEWDELRFYQGIQVLQSFSLIKKNIKIKMYSIHPLTQSCCQDRIPEAEKQSNCIKTAALLTCAAYLLNNTEENHTLLEALVTHIKANKAFAIKLGIKEGYYDDQFSCYAALYFQTGYWNQGEELQKEVMRMRKEKLGLNNTMTLNSMLFAALFHNRLGNWKEEELLLLDAIKIWMNTFGFEHETLETQAWLAASYMNQERLKEAEKLAIKVYETRKETLGTDHHDTLMSMNTMAMIYGKQGNWKEAEELQVLVMETFKAKLGPDHMKTLQIMVYLIGTYGNREKLKEAEQLLIHVIDMFKVKLGPDHPSTLYNITNLGVTYREQGRLNEAQKVLEEALETCKDRLGPSHLITLGTMRNLAMTYKAQGMLKEALDLQVIVIESMMETLGAKHSETVMSTMDLVVIYGELGKWNEAEKMLVPLIEVLKSSLGHVHPSTLRSMVHLADMYIEQEKWNEAEKLLIQVMGARKEKLGSGNPGTLTVMHNLAEVYVRKEEWSKAEELQLQIVNVGRTEMVMDHLQIIASMMDLAKTYFSQKKWSSAEQLLMETMSLGKDKLEPDDPVVLDVMGKLAMIYMAQDKFKDAEDLQAHVVKVQREKAPNDLETIINMSNLARIYNMQGKWDQAEELLIHAVEVFKFDRGPNDAYTLRSMKNLAEVYQSQEKWDRSGEIMEQLLKVVKVEMGPEHPETLSIMYHLAMSYRHQGKLKEAEKLAVHVSNVLTALVGAGHPLSIENEENLEIIRKEMTRKNKGSILSKIFRHKKH